MAEGQIYLHPQGITLTGSFAQVFFNLKRLAAYYPTLGALQHQLTPAASKNNSLSILPINE